VSSTYGVRSATDGSSAPRPRAASGPCRSRQSRSTRSTNFRRGQAQPLCFHHRLGPPFVLRGRVEFRSTGGPPSSDSLPWRFRGGNRGHYRAFVATFFLQMGFPAVSMLATRAVQNMPFCRSFSESPLTDSNRQPPPYHERGEGLIHAGFRAVARVRRLREYPRFVAFCMAVRPWRDLRTEPTAGLERAHARARKSPPLQESPSNSLVGAARESTCWSAARSVDSPCANSTSSTGRSGDGRSHRTTSRNKRKVDLYWEVTLRAAARKREPCAPPAGIGRPTQSDSECTRVAHCVACASGPSS
jgi:hypothetical protein